MWSEGSRLLPQPKALVQPLRSSSSSRTPRSVGASDVESGQVSRSNSRAARFLPSVRIRPRARVQGYRGGIYARDASMSPSSITRSLSLIFFYVFWGSVILQLINVILLSTKDTADVTQKVAWLVVFTIIIQIPQVLVTVIGTFYLLRCVAYARLPSPWPAGYRGAV